MESNGPTNSKGLRQSRKREGVPQVSCGGVGRLGGGSTLSGCFDMYNLGSKSERRPEIALEQRGGNRKGKRFWWRAEMGDRQWKTEINGKEQCSKIWNVTRKKGGMRKAGIGFRFTAKWKCPSATTSLLIVSTEGSLRVRLIIGVCALALTFL